MPLSSPMVKPSDWFFEIWPAPMFDVMTMIVLRKSTRRPWASVSFPSSRIWSRMLNTSGCAFSISSSRSTEYGFRRPAPPSCPPLSSPVSPWGGGAPEERRHGVLLHVLRHVDLQHRVLVAEEELGERARELRLADA